MNLDLRDPYSRRWEHLSHDQLSCHSNYRESTGLINRIIRTAVLGSCRSVSASEIGRVSRDESALRDLEFGGEWNLDLGVQALGKLLFGMPADVRGPVLTTNFDPHIEIGIRRAGGTPLAQWIDIDGKIAAVEDAGTIEVVHVHGLWRRGDTLHTVPQLTRERPLLAGSIRETLRGHNVVVLGYSGWPDAFSSTLLAQARERELVGMNLIWCQYSEVTEFDRNRELFRELGAGNSMVVYEKVDSNRAIPKVLQSYEAMAPVTGLPMGQSIRGWTRIDPAFLAVRSKDSGSDQVSHFYDGGEPSWKVAMDPTVPRLAFTRELQSAFRRTSKLICAGVGAMGDGKSVGLRQVVANLASDPTMHVLWREPGTIIRTREVLDYVIPLGQTLVLASDDGDLLVDGLAALVNALQVAGRSDVQMLVVAAERDWRNTGGFIRLGANTTLVSTEVLSLEDAQNIVDGWMSVESVDLGELENLPPEERASALWRSAVDSAGSQQSSLIGAMLHVRYGNHLVSRVSNLLDKLRMQPAGPDHTLEDAYLMVCILHTTFRWDNPRSRPLSLRILAASTGLSSISAQYLVLEPLGKEAAISRHGDELWTRHSSIASSALTASRIRDVDAIPRILTDVVKAAINIADHEGGRGRLPEDIYPVAYLSRFLPNGLDAVVAGQAACAAEPRRLVYVTSLMSAYREAGLPDQGLTLAESTWRGNLEWKDPESLPLFLVDWATANGKVSQPTMNALLDAIALTIRPKGLTDRPAGQALNGMGVAMRELHRQAKEVVFLNAVAGLVFLLRELKLDERGRGHLRNHEKYLRDNAMVPLLNREDSLQSVQLALDKLQKSPPEPLSDYLAGNPIVFSTYRRPGGDRH